MSRIIVTGANGFVGSHLYSLLKQQPDLQVVPVVRSSGRRNGIVDSDAQLTRINDFTSLVEWQGLIQKNDTIIHCAALTTLPKRECTIENFQAINVDATRCIAIAAAKAGGARVIFLSSVKVCGENSEDCKPYTTKSKLNPEHPYGVSKMLAERALIEVSENSDLSYTIIRPPMVYGEGCKGFISSLVAWLSSDRPLVIPKSNSERSLISITNLIDVIRLCIHNPNAHKKVFFVSDGQDCSLAKIVERVKCSLNKKSKIIYIPDNLVRWGLTLLGKRGIYNRLAGALQVEISETKQALNWEPASTFEEDILLMSKQQEHS